MHIVPIRKNGDITAFQLRTGSGSGASKLFSVRKLGGEGKAKRAAEREARVLGFDSAGQRGGSRTGRISSRSHTMEAGIRFVWVGGASGSILRVAATWVDKHGEPRHTSFSCEFNGLEAALDLAIKARMSAGAAQPNRELLLKLLRETYRTRARAKTV